MDLKNRDFLKLLDFNEKEIRYLLDMSKSFKEKKHKGLEHQ